MSMMKTPGTRVAVGFGVGVRVGVGSVPVIVGVAVPVIVTVIVPVTVGVGDNVGVGVSVSSCWEMNGRYTVSSRDARATIKNPTATTRARIHLSAELEDSFPKNPLILNLSGGYCQVKESCTHRLIEFQLHCILTWELLSVAVSTDDIVQLIIIIGFKNSPAV